MKHFVYRITCVDKHAVPKYYIGKHSGNIEDISKKYFTSSKILCPIFKENPTNFKVKIVRIFKTCKEALAFENKYLLRVDACRNPLFFNQSNYSYFKRDRTQLVTVFDYVLNTKRSISCDEYYNNNERYIAINKGLTLFKDNNGNTILCTKDYAHKNNLAGINKGFVFAKDNEGKITKLSKKDFSENKESFHSPNECMVVCKDITTGKILRVKKEEFDKNENLKGVYDLYQSKHCEICGSEISVQNFERHLNKHKTKFLWVTNGFDTWKCNEEIYFLKYSDKYSIIEKNGDNTFGFINGKPYNIRYIGKIRKENILV